MQTTINKNELLQQIRHLDIHDRLNLVADIWDEIKESQELENTSKKEKALLLSRLEKYRSNPKTATNWKDLRQEVYKKYAHKN